MDRSISFNTKNNDKQYKRNRMLSRVLKSWQLYVLFLPAFVYLVVFRYIPIYGVQIAFKKYQAAAGIWGSPFLGFYNFTKFFNSYFFWELIRNTLAISLYSLCVGFPIPVIMAVLLNQIYNKRYKKFIQTVVFAPNFISLVIVVGMINLFFSLQNGLINQLILKLGGDPVYFLGKSEYFRDIYVWSGVWQNSGFAMIIYLAALSGVDPQLHDAARIDGASKFQRIIHIDIPSIVPTIVILFILNIGNLFNIGFEKIYLLQNDLNLDVSEVIASYVYKRGILKGDMGFSTAVGLFNSVINSVLLIIFNGMSKKLSKISLW